MHGNTVTDGTQDSKLTDATDSNSFNHDSTTLTFTDSNTSKGSINLGDREFHETDSDDLNNDISRL